MVLSIIIGFITSIINTRTLGPEGYGDYKFIINLFQFMTILSSLGLSYTTSQHLTQMQSGDNRKLCLIGANFIFTVVISVFFIICSIIFSFLEPYFFESHLSNVILLFSPLVAVFIFNSTIENILPGDNKIHQLSLFRVIPALFFMLLLLLVNYIYHLNLLITLFIQIVIGIVTIIVFYRLLRPEYIDYKNNIRLIWEANKKFGWHVYIGSLSGVASTYISTFMISYFLDNTHVGYFSLAITLTMPLMQISSIVGITYFKEFANVNILPRKVTFLTALISAISTIIFILIIKPVVLMVYTESFVQVAYISSIIAIGAAIHGMGDYFNRFLGAHGQGKQLRNGAFVVGVVNILGYFILIKFFGIAGAAITRLAAGLIYCSMMIFYYIRFRKRRAISL